MKRIKGPFTLKKIMVIALIVFLVNTIALIAMVLNQEMYSENNKFLKYLGFLGYLFYYPFGYLMKEYSLMQRFLLLESIPILLLIFNSFFYSIAILSIVYFFKFLKSNLVTKTR
jgi:hypothetical protein